MAQKLDLAQNTAQLAGWFTTSERYNQAAADLARPRRTDWFNKYVRADPK
jgi:hypothetical protein